jgi:hypothetical protein
MQVGNYLRHGNRRASIILVAEIILLPGYCVRFVCTRRCVHSTTTALASGAVGFVRRLRKLLLLDGPPETRSVS